VNVSPAIARLLDRGRQNRAARQAAIAARRAPADSGDAFGAAGIVQGTRVFDRVTGQEGTVIGGTRENLVVSAPERADGGNDLRPPE
jgi:hypothetical protein